MYPVSDIASVLDVELDYFFRNIKNPIQINNAQSGSEANNVIIKITNDHIVKMYEQIIEGLIKEIDRLKQEK
jgi:hypothetical protein